MEFRRDVPIRRVVVQLTSGDHWTLLNYAVSRQTTIEALLAEWAGSRIEMIRSAPGMVELLQEWSKPHVEKLRAEKAAAGDDLTIS